MRFVSLDTAADEQPNSSIARLMQERPTSASERGTVVLTKNGNLVEKRS